LIIIVLPSLVFWVARKDLAVLTSEEFKAKWGIVYKDLRLEHPGQIMFYLIFMLRRFAFVTICWVEYFIDHPSIMLITFALFFLILGMYNGYFKPLLLQIDNMFDSVNEWFFGIHLYLMMCYTEFVITAEA
jgi:hypothetical protein